MLFAEPPPSQGDLHFSIVGIPVRVHPMFWIVGLILGLGGSRRLIDVFVWIAAMFVAILVHELGHALTMRYYGLRPWIVLHGMGGLAGYNSGQLYGSRASAWTSQILICFAGPGAGFLLALVTVGMVVATGHSIGIHFGAPCGVMVFAPDIAQPFVFRFVNALLFISVAWGLVNLLPVYPLDGGQISREILLRFNAGEGVRRSLIVSIATASAVAVLSLARVIGDANLAARMGESGTLSLGNGDLYVALLFGYLAYSSYAVLQAYGRGSRW